MSQKDRKSWESRLNFIRTEYKFGPVRQLHDELGRLHSEIEPAYVSQTEICWYREGRRHGMCVDKWGTLVYYFRGILVPNRWITHPDELTVERILTEPNQEVRYAGLQIYGFERMREEGVFEVIHADEETGAELLRFNSKQLEEPLVVVKVWNSTPEPDGTKKLYFLIVPPGSKTCQEAVAWTFGVEAKDYHPNVET